MKLLLVCLSALLFCSQSIAEPLVNSTTIRAFTVGKSIDTNGSFVRLRVLGGEDAAECVGEVNFSTDQLNNVALFKELYVTSLSAYAQRIPAISFSGTKSEDGQCWADSVTLD